MSQKIECHSKLNGMSLEMECSLKIERHVKWNVTQNGMSLKME
jgi:hypothetical protein